MKKKNLLVVGIVIIAIAVVAALGFLLPQHRTIDDNAPALTVSDAPATDAPAATAAPAADAQTTSAPADPSATEDAPLLYLLVTVQGNIYEPLPLSGEGSFTVRQGEETSNTIHVTSSSVWMEHSTCDNQDCVEQGTVEYATMGSRVLYNMIICLPNQVSLELHTAQSLQEQYNYTP